MPPKYSGKVRVPRQTTKELRLGVFPSLPSFLLGNCVAHCKKKKKNKKVWLFVLQLFDELIFFQFHPFTIDFCIKFNPYSFNYSVSGLELFIKFFFFNFIPLYLVSILDWVLIFLIVIYLILNPLLN